MPVCVIFCAALESSFVIFLIDWLHAHSYCNVSMVLDNIEHNSLKVIVIGFRSREHTLVHSISASPYEKSSLYAPSTSALRSCRCFAI